MITSNLQNEHILNGQGYYTAVTSFCAIHYTYFVINSKHFNTKSLPSP